MYLFCDAIRQYTRVIPTFHSVTSVFIHKIDNNMQIDFYMLPCSKPFYK